jgi:transcription-repair coupling factor (superfamily II helicase)
VALSDTAFERLRCIGDNTALGSGFKIAMRDLEIRGAGSLLGHRQSGQVSAVGYDLYVQLVAEAVTEAKGGVSTTPPTVVLPRLGIAHIPEDYIVAEDQRLEAYRRLTAALSDEELEDVAAEWRDRYGSLPDPARGLIDVMGLRVDALQRGIAEIATQQDGDRFYVSVRLHTMDEDTYSRLARKVGERAIDRTTGTVSLWLEGRVTTIPPVRELISEVFEPAG